MGEVPLSEAFTADGDDPKETVKALKRYFNRILYYVTDIELDGVETMPLGFTEMYMRYRTDQMLDAYQTANITDAWKNRVVLAAWGMYTPKGGEHLVHGNHSWPDDYGTDSPTWNEIANVAIDMRNDAMGWIGTPEGQAVGVELR